jgi:hypothetical protein
MDRLNFARIQNFYRNKMREKEIHKTIRIFVDKCILLKFLVFSINVKLRYLI